MPRFTAALGLGAVVLGCAAMSGASGHSRGSAGVVLALIAVHALLTAGMALARFASVHNETFDLAMYARLAWGYAHAEAWDPVVGNSVLSAHAAFVLAPLGLLGRVFGTVPVLLVAQSACAALSAYPLSVVAARRFGPFGGVAAAFAYLLYPNLGHVTTYEFHPGTLALLPLSFALEVLDRPDARAAPRALIASCVLVVLCRASLALQTAVLGAIAYFAAPPLRRVGAALGLGSVAYFGLWLAAVQVLSPGLPSPDLHYAQWGGSPFGAVRALFTEPGLVLAHLGEPSRATYLLRVLLPFALLPLLSPRHLAVAMPPLALNLLSAFPTASQLYSHYLTPAVPALAIGAVVGLGTLRDRVLSRVRRAALASGTAPALLVVAVLPAHLQLGGLPWAADFERAAFFGDEATRTRRALLARIPPGASVQAPDPLLPHLAERRLVHRAPPPERETRFVVLDVSHRARYAHTGSLLRTVQEPEVRRWLARPDHRVVFAQGDLLMLERGLSPRGGLVRRYFAGRGAVDSGRALTACLAVRGARISGKRLTFDFVARGACPSDLAIRFGAGSRPQRVDLLFDGLLSPVHLSRGDLVHSTHVLSRKELAAIARDGLYIGALRSSGARPRPHDPPSVRVAVRTE